MSTDATKPEPMPTPNQRPAAWEEVIKDMRDRDAFGRRKYDTPLQPFNGRKPLVDAYQEALDLSVYLKQQILEDGALRAALVDAYEVMMKVWEMLPEGAQNRATHVIAKWMASTMGMGIEFKVSK